MDSKKLGILGEKIAENYLKEKGYRILDKNYSKRQSQGPQKGEIDIIAQKGGVISFVEVKTQSSPADSGFSFLPEDRVNFQKQRKLAKTAESWLQDNEIPLDSKWQIDVVSIGIDSETKKAKIRYLENAIGG